jgi:hypothetical protein
MVFACSSKGRISRNFAALMSSSFPNVCAWDSEKTPKIANTSNRVSGNDLKLSMTVSPK